MLKDMLWIVPFACFAGGYYATQTFLCVTQFKAPSIEGKSLYDAAQEISNHQLTLSILRTKKDSDLAHGTVIKQTPAAGQMVKPRQTMFVTVSEQPPMQTAPHMVAKEMSAIISELKAHDIPFKTYFIPSNYPKNSCIAQYPATDQPIENEPLILYIAQPHVKPSLMPNYIGMPPQEAIDLLQRSGITPTIISTKRKLNTHPTHIINQQPLPGSLIQLTPQTSIQLHVQ
ncbi:MAG TPA: PASTA domain-containing protein [Candidatus Babeliales bacterium]|nr:PASTA domain-containing protein [Candidatus Babeliales bacterium]